MPAAFYLARKLQGHYRVSLLRRETSHCQQILSPCFSRRMRRRNIVWLRGLFVRVSEPFYFLSEQHILIAAQAAGEHAAFAFVYCFSEQVCPFPVDDIFERLLLDVSQNVIGVVGAEMHVSVVIDVCLAPRNEAVVAHGSFQFGVIGVGFFRV